MMQHYDTIIAFVSRNARVEEKSLRQFVKFGIVGALGTIVNTIILFLLHTMGGVQYLIAAAVATEIAIIFNFFGNNKYTFQENNNKSTLKKLWSFQVVSTGSIVLTLTILWALTSAFGIALVLLWNLIAIGITFIANFGINKAYTWSDKKAPSTSGSGIARAMIGIILVLLSFAPAGSALENETMETLTEPTILAAAPESSTERENLPAEQPLDKTREHAITEITEDDTDEAEENVEDIEDSYEETEESNDETKQDEDAEEQDNDSEEKDEQTEESNDETKQDEDAEEQDEDTDQPTGNDKDNDGQVDDENDKNEDLIDENPTNETPINETPINETPTTAPENNTSIDNNTVPTPVDNAYIIADQTYDADGTKTFLVYTTSETGRFSIFKGANRVLTGELIKPADDTCTEQATCLTGDFTTFNQPGLYTITTSLSKNRKQISIVIQNQTNETTEEQEDEKSEAENTPPNNPEFITTYGTHSVTLTMNTDENATVTWSVNGENQAITRNEPHTFSWLPGILYSAGVGSRNAIITAHTNNITKTWTVAVVDAINPYFAGLNGSGDVIGAEETVLHVYVNNVLNATEVKAEIDASGKKKIVTLKKKYQDEQESEWTVYLTLPTLAHGENILLSVIIINGNNTTTYALDAERSHYVNMPRTTRTSSSLGPVTTLPSRPLPFNPSVKYVLFTDDVLPVTNTTTVRLDAETFRHDIMNVTVTIQDPDGTAKQILLTLASGDRTYGTWEGHYTPQTKGVHKVVGVTLVGERGTSVLRNATTILYATKDQEVTTETLDLMDTLIGKNVVNNGGTIVITAYARDRLGVESVIAHISTPNGINEVPLQLVWGTSQWGTWEGTYTVNGSDTTHHLERVSLTNTEETAERTVTNRSIYVLPDGTNSKEKPQGKDVLTLNSLIQNPLAPFAIGVGLLAILTGIGLLFRSNNED